MSIALGLMQTSFAANWFRVYNYNKVSALKPMVTFAPSRSMSTKLTRIKKDEMISFNRFAMFRFDVDKKVGNDTKS